MTKEQKFKKEYSFELLRIAHGDLETTEVLLRSKIGRKENICFNAQQVIEKSIKAVLCYYEISVPFTHNIDILLDRIPSHLQVLEDQNLNELTEYATIRRYEEGTFELDLEDLNKAYDLAKKTYEWAFSQCNA